MNDDRKTPSKEIWDYAKEGMGASERLSFERTMLAQERTLMAWVRTATSLITFGFAVYKFFEMEGGRFPGLGSRGLVGAREFAIFMIAIGLAGLTLGGLQNRQFRHRFRKCGMKAPYSFTTLTAVLVSILGVVALLATILRW